jgi:hypothetical protein
MLTYLALPDVGVAAVLVHASDRYLQHASTQRHWHIVLISVMYVAVDPACRLMQVNTVNFY